MKKTLFILAISAFSLGVLSNNTLLPKNDLVESTELEDTKLQKVSIRRANTVTEFQTSKIYTQVDTSGTYLRFVTAIKGEVNSIKYKRTIEGYTSDKDGFEVTTLYKGISNGEEVSFYNGRKLFDEKITGTNDYYWACYTIKFATETYKNANIDVKLIVNDEEVASTSTSLNNEINYIPSEISFEEKYYNNSGCIKYSISKYSEIKNSCAQDSIVVGDYCYYTLSNPGGTSGKIVKAQLNDELSVIKETNSIAFISNTNWCSYETLGNMSYYDNKIYLIIPDGKDVAKATYACYDLDLNLIQNNCTLPVSIENSVVTKFAYNEDNKLFSVASTSSLDSTNTNITILNENKEVVNSYTSSTSNGLKYQSMFMDDRYVYTIFGDNTQSKVEIKLYDYINKNQQTLILKDDNMIFNASTSAQSISYYNGNLYIFARDWNSANWSNNVASYVYKVEVKFIESDITFAEKIDLNKKKEQEFTYEIFNPIRINSANNTQSVIKDGDYLYFGITNSGNKAVSISKYNINTKQSISSKESSVNSTEKSDWSYQTAGNLCLVNDKIYSTTINLGLKAFNKDTLEEVESDLIFDSTKVITSLAYNEELKMYVVTYAGSNTLNFYDENCSLIKKVDGINSNGLTFQTLNSNSNYIYATFGTDKTFATCINVLDWNGNIIGHQYINTNSNDYTGIKLGLDTSSTVQSIVDINGISYILTLQWNATSAGNDNGAYLYPVKL